MNIYPTFRDAIEAIERRMCAQAHSVHSEKWQSIDISKRPEAEMRELLNVVFQVPIHSENLDGLQKQILPNLPWADRHFLLERVSGEPINPGTTWREWPWGHSADKFRREGEKFSHTYAERYWPCSANTTPNGYLHVDPRQDYVHRGIRYDYGDLADVVRLLAREPLTRQAYLPVWFPEDTGVVHGERVPCSLGYHFMNRGGHLHVFYPIRSCDLTRHFRDDIYLTVRLLLWVLSRAREMNREAWESVKPGIFTMWIGSLHCFLNDHRALQAKYGTARVS